jgi:6-phosphogluconolactonase
MAYLSRRIRFRRVVLPLCTLTLLSSFTLLVTGCGNFFTCEGKPACPTTGTGGTGGTVDYAYVANSATSPNDINGYTLSGGTLTTATSAPFSLGYSPTTMAINPANTYLYVASDALLNTVNPNVGYIYGYSITTGGALSILSKGAPLVPSENVSSLAISPDGKWLFTLDTNGLTIEEYAINSTTGALTFEQTYGVTGAAGGQVTPSSIRVAPNGDYFVVALGTGGAETFTFNTTTGVSAPATLVSPANAATGIFAVAVDMNNNLYCAGSAGLQVFSATTVGVLTPVKTYLAGIGAHSIVINSPSTYVYVGNQSDSTISGYAIGTGAVLTVLTGSPYTAPTNLSALAIDSTSAYLIASGYSSSSGIQLFALGSNGALTSSATAASGTALLIPGAIAATH